MLVTPQFHHWHHSADQPAIDTNYAVHLPLLDMAFGTFHLPERHWPITYGTARPRGWNPCSVNRQSEHSAIPARYCCSQFGQ